MADLGIGEAIAAATAALASSAGAGAGAAGAAGAGAGSAGALGALGAGSGALGSMGAGTAASLSPWLTGASIGQTALDVGPGASMLGATSTGAGLSQGAMGGVLGAGGSLGEISASQIPKLLGSVYGQASPYLKDAALASSIVSQMGSGGQGSQSQQPGRLSTSIPLQMVQQGGIQPIQPIKAQGGGGQQQGGGLTPQQLQQIKQMLGIS